MPKYSGVRKTMFFGVVLASRCRGMRSDRKTISSVTGPATRFLQPVHDDRVSTRYLPRIQSFQEPSTMPSSKRGPTKRIAHRRSVLMLSNGSMGHQPSRRRVSRAFAFPYCTIMKMAIPAFTMHAEVTARILARITEGASRERVGEGRVALLR